MATVANIEVETNSIEENHDEPPPLNEKIIQVKTPEINIEQNDSRLTDPDGAQSPASSTYADCEDQNDISVSENQPEIQIKETHSDITDNEATSTKDDISTDKNENLNKSDDAVTDNNESADECKIHDDESEETKVDLKTEHNDVVEITEVKSEKKSLDEETIEQPPDEKFQEISENEEDYVDEEYLGDEHYEEKERSGPEDECSEEESDQNEEDRENGDGQEGNEDEDAAAQKQLDDDEDRRNPQYIPKRGFFYEHDDRTVNTSEDETSEGAKKEAEAEAETAKAKNRRLFPDGKWQHDLYRDDEQKPKSAQDLIDIYGYDIRNEESAPKARRRRKYGRGPNKYTRKWDDEGAYAKQMSAKPFRGRNKTSFKKEDYDDEFPAISDKKSPPDYQSKELPLPPPPAKKIYHNEPPPRNDDYKYKDEYRTNNQKSNPNYQDRTRNFSKRIPNAKETRPSFNSENYESPEYIKHVPKTIRNSQYTPPSNDNVVRGRGRGIGHGKNVRAPNNYEEGARLQFTPANRGRAKRLPKQSQHFYASKQVPDEDVQTLTVQMSATDLNSRKIISLDRQYGEPENLLPNEQSDAQLNSLNAVPRSKRYSHQRQRLLPEVNKNAAATLSMHQNIQQNMQMTHSVQNVQNVASGLCQSMAPTHTSMPLMTQNQCTPTPQTVATPLSVTPASISSSSLAVSASLIPLSAPPLTASGQALSAGAPPLPIMGFFQHPQGFANQATPAQLYTREQNVMGAPSNQPVQLVAFLPASPILSNTNHSQSAPPPPPPPPPPGFPTTVMSYQQTTQTPQNAPTFNSETYTMPPVTLAPIHQPPEVYQSRGGVTYYNTRSQVNPRSPPPPRVKTAIPIVPPPSSETLK